MSFSNTQFRIIYDIVERKIGEMVPGIVNHEMQHHRIAEHNPFRPHQPGIGKSTDMTAEQIYNELISATAPIYSVYRRDIRIGVQYVCQCASEGEAYKIARMFNSFVHDINERDASISAKNKKLMELQDQLGKAEARVKELEQSRARSTGWQKIAEGRLERIQQLNASRDNLRDTVEKLIAEIGKMPGGEKIIADLVGS